MSNNSRDLTITRKILKEISDIDLFIRGMSLDEFNVDDKTQKAVVMSLINIGELSKSYTKDFIDDHSNIPWKKIIAMRNIAAHKYEELKSRIIWDTIMISIPELKKAITK